MKRLVLYIIGVSLFTVITSSCSKWLEVKPQDRIVETDLLKTKSGFQKALNGLYGSMNITSIYGENLSFGLVDVMAQYYSAPKIENHRFSIYEYDYMNKDLRAKTSAIWDQMYIMISNVNLLIENTSNNVLEGESYNMILGQALGLRAMYHFDLLRLYGPPYSNETKDIKVLPYMKSSEKQTLPLQSSELVIESCLSDLNKAEDLLKSDPILQVKNDTKDYAQFRINLFAIQLLKARLYLWVNDYSNALAYANKVINMAQTEGDEILPFTDKKIVDDINYPDRMMASEVIFSLYNTKRDKVYKSAFAPELEEANILTFQGGLDQGRILSFYPDQNDVRYKMWQQKVVDDREVLYFSKYELPKLRSNGSNIDRYMIPLMRISEAYLIAAECDPDLVRAMKSLNTIRNVRGIQSISVSDHESLKSYIINEYRRELIGEGQLFFLYKRLKLEAIPDGGTADAMMHMDPANYIIPISEAEMENRGISSDETDDESDDRVL